MAEPGSLAGSWMAHDDDNVVSFIYVPEYDTAKGEARELTKVLRTGRTVRLITDDAIRQHAFRGPLSEAQMLKLTAPPTYSPEDGSATSIATRLVAERRASTTPEATP